MGKKEQEKKLDNLIDALMETWGCEVDCKKCPFRIKGKENKYKAHAATLEDSCGAVAIREFAAIVLGGTNPDKVKEL